MRFLILGGNGFIGSHLVDRLVDEGEEVAVLDVQGRRYDELPAPVKFIQGDLQQDFIVREALAGAEVVIHLAWATIHEVSNADPAGDVQANLIPSIRLLDACRRAGVRRIVFMSSGGTVYGPAETLPIPEAHAERPTSSYGITKLAVEKYLGLYESLHGLEHAILRPSVPYGPRQNPLGRQGAVSVFLYRVERGLPITIWGDGSVSRDFFYISDLVDAVLSAATIELGEERIFNLGGAQEVTLLDLLGLVEAAVGQTARVVYEPARAFDAPRVVLDTRRARRVLNWSPKVPLEEGLQRTWRWMKDAFKD